MAFDFKEHVTLKRGLIGGGVVLVAGLFGFGYLYSNNIENKIQQKVQTSVGDFELEENTDKIILMNGVGNINIVESDIYKTQVLAYLTYNDNVKESKLALGDLILGAKDVSPEGAEDTTMLIEANMTNGVEYFTFLEENNLIDDVEINYEIILGSDISEILVYNPVGDVNIYNTDASINVKSYIGNISARGVSPENYFLTSTDKGAINVSIENNPTFAYLSCANNEGDISIDFNETVDYVNGKTPTIPKIDNDMFSTEFYDNAYNEFINQVDYEKNKKEQFKVSTKSKNGTVNITSDLG